MKTYGSAYKYPGLLLLFLFCLNIAANSQDRIAQRRQDFYSSVETLKQHPEKLRLVAKSRQYNHDSLTVYYKELLDKYSGTLSGMNKEQKTAWLYEIGILQSCLDLTDEAIGTFNRALSLVDKKSDPESFVRLQFELGYAYREMSLFEKSNDALFGILELPSIKHDTAEQVHCRYYIAENFENLGEYQKSLGICQQLFNYTYKKGDYANASYNLIQIGRMAGYLEVDTSYFEYFHFANRLANKSGKKRVIGNNLVSTGYAYSNAGFPEKAIVYFTRGERYSADYSMRDHLYCLTGLSSAYLSLENTKLAFATAKRSMKIAGKIKGYKWMAESCEVMAGCYQKMEKFDSARYYLLEAVKFNKLSGMASHTTKLYEQLAEVSNKLNDFEKAVLYLDTAYISYKHFVAKTNGDELAKLRVESDYYIHKARITDLISRNKSEKEKSKLFIILFSAISVILVLTILFSTFRRRQLKKLKESYVGLVKKNIELDHLSNKLHDCDTRPTRKSKTENIKDEAIILKKLRKRLQKDEIFTNPELSLKMLAEDLGTNTSYLSAIVNNHFNCNLKTLINKYRIDKARKMMVTNGYSHYSMDGIASEVGFRSRSGFYLAFKSVTGITPTLYIENYNLALIPSEAETEIENSENF